MPETGQGISVGDAVLHFIGNTQALDAAFAHVEAVSAQASTNMAAGFTGFDDAVERVKDGFVGFDAIPAEVEQINPPLERVKVNLHEASGEGRLLGELFGIHLPRHVTTFVAKLPGVGEALESAFAATAVLFLLEALIKGAEKLSQWAASTLIFTQAMRDSDKAIVDTNKVIEEQEAKFKAAEQAIKEWGKSAAEVARDNLDALQVSIGKNTTKLADLEAEWLKLQHSPLAARTAAEGYFGKFSDWAAGLVGITNKFDEYRASITAVESEMEKAAAKKKADTEQHAKDELEQQKLALKEYMAVEEAKLHATTTIEKSLLDVAQANALAAVAFDRNAAENRLIITEGFEEVRYQHALAAAEAHLKILKQDGNETEKEQRAVNAEIEAMQKEHEAKQITAATKFKNDFNQILKDVGAIGLRSIPLADQILGPDVVSKFQLAEDAAKRLGVTLHGTLHEAMETARNDFHYLCDNAAALGLTTQDVTAAQIKFIAAEIAEAKAAGDTAKNIAALKAQMDALTGEAPKIQNFGHVNHQFAELLQKDMAGGALQVKFFADVSKQAYSDIAMGVGEAFAAAISGQESLGAALEKATAKVLESIGSQAMGWGMYYMALALADYWTQPLAAADEAKSGAELLAIGALYSGVGAGLGAIGGGSGGAGGTSAGQVNNTGTVGTVGRNPTNVQNVQRFADGGLITERTLAVLGDSKSGGNATEAALPLDDPRALEKIVGAFHAAGMTGGGPVINVNIRGSVDHGTIAGLCAKISKKVNTGQITLHSSSTGRVIRKSI